MPSGWLRRTAIAIAAATTLAACGGQSDAERQAEWETKRSGWNAELAAWVAIEPYAYAYWFTWGDMESPSYSIRVEIAGGETIRTDLGPDSRASFHGPAAPTIADVFELLDQAHIDASTAHTPRLEIEQHGEFGFPTDVSFADQYIDDWSYSFRVTGFEVIEPRRPDN